MTFEVVHNDALKIFSQLFVGIKAHRKNEAGIPLAFATPLEDNAAFEKRKATVLGWAKGSYWDGEKSISLEPETRILDNVPRAGFKVTDEIKKVYYGGGNVTWRIEDPDGWEVEIQSNNLMAIIQSVGIDAGGVIPGRCIWAREKAVNVLLHESSKEYQDAIKAAESIVKPKNVPMKDRVIGRTYRLANGSFGQYTGKVHVKSLSPHNYDRYKQLSSAVLANGVRKVYTVEAGSETDLLINGTVVYEGVYTVNDKNLGQGHTTFYKSISLIAELDQESMDAEELVQKVNKGSKSFAGSSNNCYPFVVSIKEPTDVFFETVQAEEGDFDFDIYIDPSIIEEPYQKVISFAGSMLRSNNAYQRLMIKREGHCLGVPSAVSVHLEAPIYGHNNINGVSNYARLNQAGVSTYDRVKAESVVLPMFSRIEVTPLEVICTSINSYASVRRSYDTTVPNTEFAPNFKCRGEVLAWFKEQYAAGNLVKTQPKIIY